MNAIVNENITEKYWETNFGELNFSQKIKYIPKYIKRSLAEAVTGPGTMFTSGVLNELGYESPTRTLVCVGVGCFLAADGYWRMVTERGLVERGLDIASYSLDKLSNKCEKSGKKRLSYASRKLSEGLDYASFKVKSLFHGRKKMERICSEQLSQC